MWCDVVFVYLIIQVPVPDGEMAYWCQGIRLPKLEGKHHVIKVEYIISHLIFVIETKQNTSTQKIYLDIVLTSVV